MSDQILERVAAAGKRHAEAEAERSAASAELAAAVHEARDAGAGATAIARAAGIHRSAVYQILERDR